MPRPAAVPRLLVLAAIVLVSLAGQGAPDRVAGWRADLDSVVATIVAKHPDPFTKVTRDAFEQRVGSIRDSVPLLDDPAVAVRLMQLVAMLGDGHSRLGPGRLGGFERWFPVRFYRFSDGLFITAVARGQDGLLGARVLRIGRLMADSAAMLARSAYGFDNTMGAAEATFYLSSVPVLHAFGVTRSPDTLDLDLELRGGAHTSVRLAAQTGRASIGWAQWGEMFGPIFPDSAALTTPFGGIAPLAYRTEDPARPLHLRYRSRWRYWLMPERDMAYFQLNFMQDSDAAPFEPFVRDMFRAIDGSGVGRMVIDIRYDGGGDGTMARVIIHELIKRDTTVNRPGHLFVLVGRKTFSAGIGLLEGIIDHTSAILVGEPAGAPLNHFGDPTTSTLSYSGMPLSVSTRFWQFSTSDDRSSMVGIQVPAPFTSRQWFAAADPALDAIERGEAVPFPTIVAERGGAASLAHYQRVRGQVGAATWWQPWDHRTMRRTGDSLLAIGRLEDARAAYQLNTSHYPCEWRSWDSYAEGSLAAADSGAARAAFQRALELEPDNWNNARQREALGTLSRVAPGSVPGDSIACRVRP